MGNRVNSIKVFGLDILTLQPWRLQFQTNGKNIILIQGSRFSSVGPKMDSARTIYLLLWCLFFQKTESKPSNLDGNSLPEVTSLLEDYFDWKVDTYQFEYYISGINKHPGKLDDYGIER